MAATKGIHALPVFKLGKAAAARDKGMVPFENLLRAAKKHQQVRQAIFSDVGVGLGVQLPTAAQAQVQTGQPWSVTTGPDVKPGSWGGHYVFVPGYTATGPVCVTWGRKQQMTWDWLNKYCDEAYAIFDAANRFKKTVVSEARLDQMFPV